MYNTAYEPQQIKTHQKIIKVVDGDGFYTVDMFGNNEKEIRLLGIDAPEIKRCKKLRQDERETHLPGQLLMELGQVSKEYLSGVAPPGTLVSLLMESTTSYDIYGRTLAYAFLPNGSCLNEMLLEEGYVKPYEKYICTASSWYRQVNFKAKQEKRGHYSRVNSF